MQKRLFSLIVALAIFLAGCGIFYYFVFYLPLTNTEKSKQSEQAFLFSKKMDCEKLTDSIKKEIDKGNDNKFALSIESFEMIFYSPKENACIYATDRLTTDGSSQGEREYFIYNALTQSKITSFKFPSQWQDYKNFLYDYSNGEIRL